MNELTLDLVEREERIWLEFMVDGYSLYSLIQPDFPQGVGVTCLTLLYNEQKLQKALDSLLLRRPADFPDNRHALYVCNMCGDLDCGALTVVIEEDKNAIIWRNFGWENTYEDNLDRVEGVGPFMFDKVQYIDTLTSSVHYLDKQR
jgi:hypothetical protein